MISTQEETRKQENEAFEASPLGKLRRRLRETLAAYGVHGERDLSHVVYCSWIWADNPAAYFSTLSLSSLLDIAEQVGIDLQELLFGNPEGAPLRQLDEQMQQAVQEPQPAPIWHPYPDEKPEDGQKVLTLCHSNYVRDNYGAFVYRAGGWYLPEMPDNGLMKADVRWWSAELPPEQGK